MKYATRHVRVSAGKRALSLVIALCVAITMITSSACAASVNDKASSYTVSNATIVKFTDSKVSASGAYSGWEIDGTSFIIKESGTYVFSGSCSDGNIEIKKELTDVTVVFNGLNLTSKTTAPFNAKSDTDVTVILASGSSNSLADVDRDAEKPKSCMNSSGDLTIAGRGMLSVTGNNKQGIKADGVLAVTGGKLTVSAVKKALKADEKVIIGTEGGADSDLSITVTSSYEGIESENVYFYSGTVDITSSDDGVNSASSDDDSTTDTANTADSSALASGAADSSNAGKNRGGFGGGFGGMEDQPEVGDFNIHIYGGDITVNAGGDGLDSNGSIYMYGGNVKVFQTGMGDGALDYETDCKVTGGTLLAAGSAGMAATPTKTDGSQPYLNFRTEKATAAGNTVNIKDSSGKVVYTAKIPVSVQSVIFSSASLKEGSSYTLYENGTEQASAEATTESGKGFGGGFGGGQRPDGMTPPEGFDGKEPSELPEGFDGNEPPELPEGFDGKEPPELPEGMTRPDGNGGRPGSFTDVASGSWYEKAVEYVTRSNLMSGTGSNKFSPDSSMTRAMLVTVLWRAEGQPEASAAAGFTDVDADSWYSTAVSWAVENGIVNGTSDTTFSPNKNITRQEIAAIIQRYAKYKGADVSQTADINSYTDSSSVASWASDAMAWAVKNGVITGATNTTLAPLSNATRAQTATMLMRYMQK